MAKPLPFVVNPHVLPDPKNPHSWLTLIGHEPGASTHGWRVMTGTLRPQLPCGYRPSLVAFARAKLAPAAESGMPAWSVSAYRHEVLLPADAGDHLRDPRLLVEIAEREQPADAKALASYITLTSTPSRLHAAYEVGRSVARRIADAHGVGVLLVQHVPSVNGSTARPHLHLVAVPRQILPWSFGPYVSALIGDRTRDLVLGYLADVVGETGI